MAYNKPSAGGYKKPTPTNNTPTTKPTPAKSGDGDGGGGKRKPDFRIAMVEKNEDGKEVTVKGENGKTEYLGAAWANKFGGFNVVFDDGTRARMYPVEEKA